MPDSDNIVLHAIDTMAEPVRDQAREVVLKTAAGWGAMEIAKELDTTWQQVNEIKRQIGDAVVRVLVDEEGYSRAEAVRLLRVPDHLVSQALVGSEAPRPKRHAD